MAASILCAFEMTFTTLFHPRTDNREVNQAAPPSDLVDAPGIWTTEVHVASLWNPELAPVVSITDSVYRHGGRILKLFQENWPGLLRALPEKIILSILTRTTQAPMSTYSTSGHLVRFGRFANLEYNPIQINCSSSHGDDPLNSKSRSSCEYRSQRASLETCRFCGAGLGELSSGTRLIST